jgi:hypothetical protein
MRISKKGFVEAIKTFRKGPQNGVQEDIHARIVVAAGFIIRQQRGISEEEVWSPTPTEVADFLDGLDDQQLRKLKQLAESLLQEPVYTGHA